MTEYLQQHGTTLVCIAVYVGVILYLNHWFRKIASRNVNAYYLAERQIPGWVVSLAFFSTFISTSTYIGQAGESFRFGFSWVYVGLIWVMFCMISWLLLGPKMRAQSVRLKSVTVPDYFHLRYQSDLSRVIRVLSSVIILFATLWYMTGIAKGGANLLSVVLDMPYWMGAFFLIFFTCAYTVIGGMYGVMWTDAVQGILMLLVAVIMVVIPFVYVGGWGPMMEKLSDLTHPGPDGRPLGHDLFEFGKTTGFAYILAIGFSIGMKQISDPKLIIRFYSIKNKKDMRFAMIWTPIFLGLSLLAVMSVGALVHGMVSQEQAVDLMRDSDEVVGMMFKIFNNPLLTGISMMGLFAAGMSSLASVTLIAGTSIVKDIWQMWQPMSEQNTVRLTKVSMIVYCLLVYIFTLNPPAGVVEMSSFAGSVFAASFFPTIFGGLYFRWGTDIGALASMIAGMIVNVVWRFGIRFSVQGMEQVHEVFPAFLISLLVYVLASRWTAHRRPDHLHLDVVFGKRSKEEPATD
jgi:SSS family transporter